MRGCNIPYLRVVCTYSNECNFKCKWCHQEGINPQSGKKLLSSKEIAHVVSMFYNEGLKKIKLIGGEPTLRKDLSNIIYEIRSLGNDIDISLVTNGSVLSKKIKEYHNAGLSRVNITLPTLDIAYFLNNIGDVKQFYSVLEGIDKAVEMNMCSKINHIYHDFDDFLNIIQYACMKKVRVNLLNMIPSSSSSKYTTISEITKIVEKLPIVKKNIEYDPFSLPVMVYHLDDNVEIELKYLEMGEQNFLYSCDSCKQKAMCKEGIFAFRLTPVGDLQPCLIRDDNILSNVHKISKEQIYKYMKEL